jgi:hypothetical protein
LQRPDEKDLSLISCAPPPACYDLKFAQRRNMPRGLQRSIMRLHCRAAADGEKGYVMTDDLVVFAVFTLGCGAFLVFLMLEYSRRINRLRNMVGTLGSLTEMAPQPVYAPRKKT